MPFLRPWSLVAASSLLLILSFPRPALGWLAFFALVPLLWALRDQTPGGAFLRGWACGTAWFLVSLRWLAETIHLYGSIPVPLAWLLIVLMAAFLGLWTGLFAWAGRPFLERPGSALLFVPAAWVLMEYARSWLPAPFPWLLLGSAFWDKPVLLPLYGFLGVYGASYLAAVANVALLHASIAFGEGRRRRAFSLALLAPVLVAAGVGAAHSLNAPLLEGRVRLGVAVVQGSFRQEDLWGEGRRREIVETYLALTRRAAGQGAQIVVWPESSLPFYLQDERWAMEALVRLVEETGIDLVAGSLAYELRGGRAVLKNSAFHFGPGGIRERYDKTRLVPFGEYVPFPRFFFFVRKLVSEVGEFEPGRWGAPFATRIPSGALVCYEVAFPDIPRREVRSGARLLLNITNDAWYGTSWGPYQHLAFASLRAAENGVPVVRAANTGISAVIGSDGRSLGNLGLFQRGVLSGEVEVAYRRTFYSERGDWLVLFAAVLVIISGISRLTAGRTCP